MLHFYFLMLFWVKSPGVMLVIGGKKDFSVPLRVINIENGELLKTVDYAMKRSKVEFIEQFNEKVLIKQEQENLQILDVINSNDGFQVLDFPCALHCPYFSLFPLVEFFSLCVFLSDLHKQDFGCLQN